MLFRFCLFFLFLTTLIDHYKSECQRRLLESHKFQWGNHERQLNGYVVLLSQAFDSTLLVDKTLKRDQHIIEEMATNPDFADSRRFEEILRLLDDANNAMMAQLSGALRSVKRLLRQNLLDQSFDSYTDLMRYISRLNLRDQDLTDLAQVGDSLQNIQRVVEDAGENFITSTEIWLFCIS